MHLFSSDDDDDSGACADRMEMSLRGRMWGCGGRGGMAWAVVEAGRRGRRKMDMRAVVCIVETGFGCAMVFRRVVGEGWVDDAVSQTAIT